MPFDNFESRHFTNEEHTAVETAITALETALTGKMANLSASERQQYGSIGEQNKLIVNKVKEYHETQPNLSAREVDWDEFHKDYASRGVIASVLQRLSNLQIGLNNARILHDWDNYQAALRDYEYAKYMNSTTTVGYEAKVNELAQFFANRANTRDTNIEAENDAPSEDPNNDSEI